MRTLEPGAAVLHLEFTPRGEAVWISSRDANRVSVVDTASFATLATLPVDAPSGIFFTSRAARLGHVMDAPVQARSGLDRAALLNAWQRALPLVPRPFDALGAPHGLDGARRAHAAARGAGARRGEPRRRGVRRRRRRRGDAVRARGRAERLDAVGALGRCRAGVSHNYAREHALNLWFVASARDADALAATIGRIERHTGLAALRLPMRRAYRIDLGFDLFEASRSSAATRPAVPVEPALRPLAARLEALGVPLLERPYAALGAPLGLDEASVLAILARWCEQGTLRRLGVVLRHHEFGITANAMAVFARPEDAVDAAGERLAAQPGVTLCYRRASAARWPYTLYCMVHGRERAAVQRRWTPRRAPPASTACRARCCSARAATSRRAAATSPNRCRMNTASLLDATDALLLRRLHGGFPLGEQPYAEVFLLYWFRLCTRRIAGPSFTRSNTSLLAIVQALAYGVYARDKGAYKDRIRAFKLK